MLGRRRRCLLNRTPAPAGLHYVSVAVGRITACGVLSNRAVQCWGFPLFPTSPPTGPAATEVSVGYEHACARQPNGTPLCFGDTISAAIVPVGLVDQPYTYIGAGDRHSCALRADGSVDCWGQATFGKTTPPVGIYDQMSVGPITAAP